MEEAPGSTRELARAAGVSHTLLSKIRKGERTLTPETRTALAQALRTWGERCEGLAAALEETPGKEGAGE